MDSQEIQRIKNGFDIVGNDEALNRALETAVAVAPYDLTVLITGESGVGKEAIPQIIHKFSRRKTGKYLAINCGAIPSGTISAELFGHEKGSFTGAVGEHKGYFEEADGGTIFLDEIGELPLDTQAMLLRVLQNGEYMKVGSARIQKSDVRVIAATNRDLSYAVATGKFRQDLYYRLSGIRIQVPSLRERKGDIYLLFRKFSSDFAEKYGLCKINLSHDAITLLTSYRWPGNIRQIKNTAEAVTGIESRPSSEGSERIEIGPEILMRHMPQEKDSLLPSTAANTAAQSPGSGIGEADKQMIVKAILDLKQEVDTLRQRLDTMGTSDKGPRRELPSFDREEPEEQIFNETPGGSEPLSMKQNNDDLIEKTLLKYGGKVKPAARELGISERTIYRKLASKKER